VSQRYLYWSSLEQYELCPRSFLWGHGYGTIDLGRGPGRSKAKPVQDSKHHAVMGIVLARAIEHLYNDELWREPETLVQKLTDLVTREFTFALNEHYINWDEAPPKSEMLDVCLKGVTGYLKTMKANKLLGPYAKSEVDLTAWVDQYTPVGGRPDVIVRRDDTGITILDGKNSLTPGKYTNPDQLRWYALCFYLAYNTLPNRLAFVYFRYPEGTPPKDHPEGAPWTGLVEVPFTREDLKTIGVRAKETHRAMSKELFDPSPSAKACRFCDYKTVCDSAHQPTPRKPKSLPVVEGTVEHTISNSDGIVEFGFDVGVKTKP
jgi:hypothetical protein